MHRAAWGLGLLLADAFLGIGSGFAVPPATSITANGLGTSVSTTNPGFYNITGGTTSGGNLYHSFSALNLGTGSTANFIVSSNVANILARVTGGPSSIDGTITSTVGSGGPISGANLFLINPAGVLFTANAQVNLGGSFIVSTADYVKFSDGTTFYGDANHPIDDAGLHSAPVSAFGFLSATPRPISATSSRITMSPNTGLHLVGGDVNLDAAHLLAPAGALTLFSAASSGEVPFSLASPGSGYAAATVTQFGSIHLTNGAQARIDADGGGSIVIRGGRITVDHSDISSSSEGPVPGGGISIQAEQMTIRNGALVATDSIGGASSGPVSVTVSGDLTIFGTGSKISADTESAGDAGQVRVDVGGAIDLDGGNILANTNFSGKGGTVEVSAASMSMEADASVASLSGGDVATGDAGTVNLTLSGALRMTDSTSILADTYTDKRGGDIHVVAGQINMAGQSSISASTRFASGPGGNISVTCAALTIDSGSSSPAGIFAQSINSGGAAGTVDVVTGALGLNNGALISTSSIFGSGNGGSVSVSCSQGVLSGQSSISASASKADAGSVVVNASQSLSLYSGSTLDTSASGRGGDITMRVGQLLYLRESSIQAFAGVASVAGPAVGGNGGNITIDPQFVVLDHSLISANDLSPIGKDGNISLTSDFFFENSSLLFATGTIETTPPNLDLTNGLLVLQGAFVDAHLKLRDSCAQSVSHEFSTFTVRGRGGIESAPEELQPDFGLGSVETQPAKGE